MSIKVLMEVLFFGIMISWVPGWWEARQAFIVFVKWQLFGLSTNSVERGKDKFDSTGVCIHCSPFSCKANI